MTADPETGRLVATPRSASHSAAIWDGVHNRLAAALTIQDADEHGMITAYNVFLPYRTYEITRVGETAWSAIRYDTAWPEPCAIAFVSDPQLTRPLGSSRISAPVMAATDAAFRTMVRMEASAEFYSVPKLWFLGASRDAFDADTWSNLVSAINGVSSDAEGEKPTMQQVQQASMTPHSAMLETIARLISSETDLPVDALGITSSNPSSAEAMAAAERRLTRRADRQNRVFGSQLVRLMRMAVCMRDHLDTPPEGLNGIRPIWAPTREISDAARADAYVKISGVNPAYAASTVGLHRLGLTASEIASLQAAMTRENARTVLEGLLNAGTNN